MLTIYTKLKPFKGYIGTIQRNALKSWSLLKPKCEIIIFGDEEGTAEVAKELGIRHVPDIKRNEYGTALVSDIFNQAQEIASNDLLCFINGDIILMDDFMKAVEMAEGRKERYLMCGRRTNLDLKEPIDFSDGWEEWLRDHATANGKLAGADAIDFFIFHKGFWGKFPPFTIGRPRYDNWMIYTARHRGDTVIDATPAVLSVHQNHDYRHIPKGSGTSSEGPEAEINKDLYGRKNQFYSLMDASVLLTKDGFKNNINYPVVKHTAYRLLGIP